MHTPISTLKRPPRAEATTVIDLAAACSTCRRSVPQVRRQRGKQLMARLRIGSRGSQLALCAATLDLLGCSAPLGPSG